MVAALFLSETPNSYVVAFFLSETMRIHMFFVLSGQTPSQGSESTFMHGRAVGGMIPGTLIEAMVLN